MFRLNRNIYNALSLELILLKGCPIAVKSPVKVCAEGCAGLVTESGNKS